MNTPLSSILHGGGHSYAKDSWQLQHLPRLPRLEDVVRHPGLPALRPQDLPAVHVHHREGRVSHPRLPEMRSEHQTPASDRPSRKEHAMSQYLVISHDDEEGKLIGYHEINNGLSLSISGLRLTIQEEKPTTMFLHSNLY